MPTIRHDPQIGSLFQGRYELLSELGAGSFGRVYRARQLSTGQDVAIKIVGIRDGAPSNDNRLERFRRETRLCSELFHPNIVRLIDSGDTEDGTVYAAFEYVPGLTLQQLIAEQGRLPLREAVHLMSQVLDALSCAHGRGVVHRDLKPENIMVAQTGVRRNAMVLDFGLGGFAPEADGWGLPRITASQEMMGTPCYAAPEQLRGETPTTRSDLYSWGLIFIEALTGELAVRGASVQEAILRQLNDEPIAVPAEISDERLRKLLATVTAKAVEKRDVTIEGLLRVLSLVESREPLAELDMGESERPPGSGGR